MDYYKKGGTVKKSMNKSNIKYLVGIIAVVVIMAVSINLIIKNNSPNNVTNTENSVFYSSEEEENIPETVAREMELAYSEEQKMYREAADKFEVVPIYTGNKSFTDGKLNGSELSATYEDIEFAAYLDGKNPSELSWGKVTIASPSDGILRKKGDTYAICGDTDGTTYVVSGDNKDDVIEAYKAVMVTGAK